MRPGGEEYFSRLDRLFHDAIGKAEGTDRDAFLEFSCGGDPALLADLRRLLDGDAAVRRAVPSAVVSLPRFGIYQARQLIGRGGMGAVYLATREDGEVSLRVAVKVISSPLWSSVLEERFRRERQILAQLRHPGIAAFLDGGVSADGLPFLVMEYVEGEPIDRWCASRNVSVNSRLEVFLKICEAVGFAHQQLIVHRDIKPANVLVTAAGEPKLLDFGLARTMESAVPQLENPTLFLTPLYASPEVLRGRPAAVTDDIYSLGVLLCELLTGQRPFAGSTPAEIIEAVLHSEPRRLLKGDLDAIALKAIAKSAAERYSSVAQLAGDVRNYLSGRPVEAAAGGAMYHARKLLRRHTTAAIAVAIILISISAGITSTLVEARAARQQRAAAERRFQEARALTHYMMFELQSSIQKLPGSTPVKADMVRHSLDYLDRLAVEKSNDDDLRIEIADGYSELADVLGNPLQSNLGEAAQARTIYQKAIGMLEPVVARNPASRQARSALARARLMLGISLVFYRQWDQGRKLVEASAREYSRLAQTSPRDFQILKQAAVAHEQLAVSISQRDGYTTGGDDTATAALRQSIAFAERALALNPGEPETVSQLASGYNRLALLTQTFDRPSAAVYFDRALATLDSLPESERAAATIRSRRAALLLASGWNLGSAGDFDRGLRSINESRVIMERLAGEDPKNRIYPQARASIYRNLGVIEDYASHTTEALAAYQTAISIFQQLLAANPASPYYRTTLADLQANSALLSAELGRHADAVRFARAGIPVLKETALKPDASASELNLAARFLTEKDLPEMCDARLGLQFAERADTASAGKDYVLVETLAQAYWMNGDRDKAVQSIERAIALIGGTPGRVRGVFEKTLAEYRAQQPPRPCRP